jgi:hypothetical protein
MNETDFQSSLLNSILNMPSILSCQEARAKRKGKNRVQQIHEGKMPLVNPIDVIVALLHQVVAPRHRCRGGWCHHCPTPAPTLSALAPIPFPRSTGVPADGALRP